VQVYRVVSQMIEGIASLVTSDVIW